MKSSEVSIKAGVVLDDLSNLVLVSIFIVQEISICPCSKRKVSNGDLITHDVLVRGVGLNSLIEDLEPVGESGSIERFQSLGLSFFRGCEISGSIVNLSQIFLTVKNGIDSPCKLSISEGIVTMLNSEVAEKGCALSEEFSRGFLEDWELPELEFS